MAGPKDFTKHMDGDPYKVEGLTVQEDAPCQCSGCDWSGVAQAVSPIGDCHLTAGDASPAGRCPECDSLVYLQRPIDKAQAQAEELTLFVGKAGELLHRMATLVNGAEERAAVANLRDEARALLDRIDGATLLEQIAAERQIAVPTLIAPDFEPDSAAANACRRLIRTVEATGGLLMFESGQTAPAGDEDWLDLADAYQAACEAMGQRPMIARNPYDDADAAVSRP